MNVAPVITSWTFILLRPVMREITAFKKLLKVPKDRPDEEWHVYPLVVAGVETFTQSTQATRQGKAMKYEGMSK